MQNLLSLFAPRLKHNSFREMFSSSGSGFRQIFLLVIIVSVISIVEFYLMIQKSLTIEVNRKDDVQPLILLFTHNHSRKTRDHICRGLRNENHLVNFDACPKKCQFSCRREDFHRRETLAVLFFGEDFYWPFQLSDRNRTSFDQRWIFWSWEAPVHHPEYTKTSLTFNW